MARRIIYSDNGLLGSGNPPNSYKFVGYNGLTYSQLDSNGNITPIGGGSISNIFTTLSTGTITITNGASAGYVLTSNDSGVAYWTASTTGSLIGSGTSDYLPKWINSSTLGNSLIRDGGSTIGIGTTPSLIYDYLTISDDRKIEQKRSIVLNHSFGTSSNVFSILTSKSPQSIGLVLEANVSGDYSNYGIRNIIYGTSSLSNRQNIINIISTSNTYTTSNSQIYNYISVDYRSNGAVQCIRNVIESMSPSMKGVSTTLAGTSSFDSVGEFIEVNTRSLNRNYGIQSYVYGNSDNSNIGIEVGATHPVDNSRSYGIIVISGKSIFNNDSNSYSDFQIKGDTNEDLFYVDASVDSIGIGTSTPNSKSILELSSTTKGFLPPRMTQTQRTSISTPPVGLIVYQTDATEGLYVYKSTGWTFIS